MSGVPSLVRIGDGVVALQLTTDAHPHVGPATVTALETAAEEIGSDESIRALVIEGGTRHFCSGGTREMLLGPDAPEAIARLMGGLPRALLSMPVPTLAAMVGHAIGGGLMVGLWCDVALLGEESLYAANFLALGFTPGMGATVLLEEMFGGPLSRDLLLTGRMVKGREIKAASVPLSHAVLPCAEVRARTLAKAADIARTPRSAMALFRRHLAKQRGALLERALSDEHAMHAVVFADSETRAHIAENYPGSDAENTDR